MSNNQSVSLSGPVKIRSESDAATAFDLMIKIAGFESNQDGRQNDRQYWLKLYRQCYKATHNHPLESILKAE